ncbi:MAG: diaminopimelate epimerase [Candidatus Omnitrophica bacterium]|nr:diaminopimelate epimerase [Candidatus Omnitrophota bacterium]
MRKLKFTKMSGAGNDFIVVDTMLKGHSRVAQELCQKNTGIGADGLLVLGKSKRANFKMRIFNADGSEAEMCGNGLRCAALYVGKKGKMKIETIAGMYEAEITAKDRVRIKMEGPKDLRRDLAIKVNGRNVKVGYIDTGVPHAVIFVQGIEAINVDSIGRNIRYHAKFKPRGTNVDFVEIVDDKNIKMRTYERGVEGETLACGTGAVASAIISGLNSRGSVCKINVHTKGGVLRVYFKKVERRIKDVHLEGEARKVFEGEVDYV